jgi:hypothetical protein
MSGRRHLHSWFSRPSPPLQYCRSQQAVVAQHPALTTDHSNFSSTADVSIFARSRCKRL